MSDARERIGGDPTGDREPALELRAHQEPATDAHVASPSAAQWHRLDPRMLFVHPIREMVRFLPALLGLFVAGAATGGGRWQLLGVVVPVALGVLRYLTTSFRISGDRVELRRGLISRHLLSARVDRVRTVDLTSSLIQRALGLTTVRIGTGTASSDDDESLDLDGLPADRARQLRSQLLHARSDADADADEHDQSAVTEDVVVCFDASWLRFAPLTSSGVVLAAGIVGIGSQVLNSIDTSLNLNPAAWAVDVPLWTAVLIGVVGLALLTAVLAVGGYLVTNWGFTLSHARRAWHVRKGLFTTRETSIDDERVAGVTIGEPLGLRAAGGGRLSAIVTGLGGQSGSSALVPPAPRPVIDGVAKRVLGTAAPIDCTLVRHGPAARRRRYLRALVPASFVVVAVALVVLLTDAPAWLLILAVALPLIALVLAADRVRSLGHALTDGYVVARSGSLYRHRDALATGDVIGWNLRATWFQRRVGLTTLVATTAGGRQSVTMIDVPEDVAVALAERALPQLVTQFALGPGS